jgi:hypothetical protein
MQQQAIRQSLLEKLANLISRSARIDAYWRDEAPPKDWEELAIYHENDEVIDSLDERAREQIYDQFMCKVRAATRARILNLSQAVHTYKFGA